MLAFKGIKRKVGSFHLHPGVIFCYKGRAYLWNVPGTGTKKFTVDELEQKVTKSAISLREDYFGWLRGG